MGEAAPRMPWWEADPSRAAYERGLLPPPWQLEDWDDGELAWNGGHLKMTHQGITTPARKVRLVYPPGYPARFVNAWLDPPIPRERWAMTGAHVNSDGSACYIAGEAWTPQMTVKDALKLLKDWWFNYWVIVEKGLGLLLKWPTTGLADIPRECRAALR